MHRTDWINVGTLTAPIAVLFSFGFGLFAGPAMSPFIERLWVIGGFVIAGLTWWSTAQSARSSRLSRLHDQEIKDQLGNLANVTGEPASTKVLSAAASKILDLEQQIEQVRQAQWRRITSSQRDKFINNLSLAQADALRNAGFIELLFLRGDPEAESYAKQLSELVRKIGVQVGIDGLRMTPEYPALDKFGLVVLVKDINSLHESAQWLMRGFDWSGIKYHISSEGVVPHARPEYLGLRVGPQPELTNQQ